MDVAAQTERADAEAQKRHDDEEQDILDQLQKPPESE
jgi:hypothetical protein